MTCVAYCAGGEGFHGKTGCWREEGLSCHKSWRRFNSSAAGTAQRTLHVWEGWITHASVLRMPSARLPVGVLPHLLSAGCSPSAHAGDLLCRNLSVTPYVCTVYIERRTFLVAMRCLQQKFRAMFGGQMYTRTCRLATDACFLPIVLINCASDCGAESHDATA